MENKNLKLVNLNSFFYSQNSESFSKTRVKEWDGWVKGLAVLEQFLNKQEVHFFDFASGNLRFEKYLEDVEFLKQKKTKFFAFDNCVPLLEDVDEFLKKNVKFQEVDLISSLIDDNLNFEVIYKVDENGNLETQSVGCCFGFFHHIPNVDNRKKFLKFLTVQNFDFLFLSFWQFAKSAKGELKAQNDTNRFFENQNEFRKIAKSEGFEVGEILQDELEENDYIYGWQNQSNAFRYCHSFTDSEVEELLDSVNEYKIVSEFLADGKTDLQNKYVILKRVFI